MQDVCQLGMMPGTGNIFFCAANFKYKVGSKTRIVECQAVLDPETSEVIVELDDGRKGAFCHEN